MDEMQSKLTHREMMEFVTKTLSKASSVLLSSLSKTDSVTYEEFTKETFRTYNKNPLNNESKFREMSQFLARVSMPYKRILWYYASIPLFNWTLTPQIDDVSTVDNDTLLNEYLAMSKRITKMSLTTEMKNVLYIALRDGVYYGVIYEGENDFFLQKLDPDYCRPVQIEAGVWNFAFDFSYFDKNKDYLEMWGDSMFQSGYDAYKQDKKNMKWQILEPSRTICIKSDIEHILNIPFFSGIFEALIDLIDARTLQRNKDVIDNYKLIIQKMPTFDKAEITDDWKLEVETALKYFNMLSNSVPDNVGVTLSPMDIDTVDFKQDDNSDVLADAMRNVFNDSGVSEMLFNSNKSGSIGLEASIKTDIGLSWIVVDYIQKWLQRFLDYDAGKYKFKFEILRTDIFNKDSALDVELKLAQNGIPNKIKLAATAGLTPIDVISNQILENSILNIPSNWIPLSTSYTQSGSAVDTSEDISIGETDDSSDE